MYRLLIIATTLAGCYSPSFDNCTIRCDTTGCPNSYECDSALHVCRHSGTTCGAMDAAPGDGDGGGSGDGGDGGGMPGRCTLVQRATNQGYTTSLTIGFNTPTRTGDLIVVAVSGHASNGTVLNSVTDEANPAAAYMLADEIGGPQLISSIRFLPGVQTSFSLVNVSFSQITSQAVSISEWQCPSGIVKSGNARRTGPAQPTADFGVVAQNKSLVIAAVATPDDTPARTTSPLLMQLSTGTDMSNPNNMASLGTAYGYVPAGNVDLPFNLAPAGAPWSGTAVVFDSP